MKKYFMFAVSLLLISCADSEVGEKIHDNISYVVNYSEAAEIDTEQRCTNCCKACSNYNGPGQVCWYVPCAISEE